MKSIKIFTALMVLVFGLANTPLAHIQPKAVSASTIFRGNVIGKPFAPWVEIYINHVEQRETVDIVPTGQGEYTYELSIPVTDFPMGSVVMFKIDDQVYGFGTLDGAEHILDLQLDEQSRCQRTNEGILCVGAGG